MEPQQSIPAPTTPPQPVSSTSTPHSNKRLLILVVILVLLLLGAIGVFAYQTYNTPKQSTLLPPLVPEQVISPTPSETSEWMTYRNEEYEIEFKYPSNWYSYETESMEGIYQRLVFLPEGSEPEFTAQEVPGNTLLDVLLDKQDSKSIEKIYEDQVYAREQIPTIQVSKTSINGLPAVTSTDHVAIIKPSDNLRITVSASREGVTYFDQILSTFRFVEDSTSINEDSSLKTETVTYKEQPNDTWFTVMDPIAKYKVQFPNQPYKLTEAENGRGFTTSNCHPRNPDGTGEEICLSGFRFTVYQDYDGKSRRAWINNKYELYRPYYQNLVVDGANALVAVEGNPGGSSSGLVAIPKGNTMIVYTVDGWSWNPETNTPPDLTGAKQILSTFKFQ